MQTVGAPDCHPAHPPGQYPSRSEQPLPSALRRRQYRSFVISTGVNLIKSVTDIFAGAAAKYLTQVDANPSRSNQHEIGGLVKVGFGDYLGLPPNGEKYYFNCLMAYARDDEEALLCESTVTWYDGRWGKSHRSPEYRLYYKSNPVTNLIQPDDFMLVAKKRDGSLVLLFTPPDSSTEHQLRYLFGLSSLAPKSFTAATMPAATLVLPIKYLLDQLGIVTVDPRSADDDLALMLERFPDSIFPSTSILSSLARELVDTDCIEEPDNALIAWMEREEELFKAYERHIVSLKLKEGFNEDVDDFLSFSLSVQNRRKSRAGHAFEHHLRSIFQSHALAFESGSGSKTTENKSKPDFLFPGFTAYHDTVNHPSEQLVLLGAKTTCKDRWRQVLSEGDRVTIKHLVTLEAGISESQTAEMKAKGLQLVVPASLQPTYTPQQRQWLYSLADFIQEVRSKTQETT